MIRGEEVKSLSLKWRDLTIDVNFFAQIHVDEPEKDVTRIQLSWQQASQEKPRLCIAWERPLKDIQGMWHPSCRKDRSLRADWDDPFISSLFRSAPVFCFYNEDGRSRLTIALSDGLTEIHHHYGVHEEDGTLRLRIEVPMNAVRSSTHYELLLLRDERDCPYEECLRRVSAWWENACGYAPMPVPEVARLPMYSTWYSYHQQITAEKIEAECALAVQDGYRTVIVDDGWQTSDCSRGYGYCGDWLVAKEKIPDMRAHVARVHALGMKYMLWYNVAFVGEYSAHWHTFQDKLLTRVEHLHAGVMDPRYPEVRRFLIDTYVRALRDWDLDGFKLDFVDSFTPSSRSGPWKAGMDFALVEDAVYRLMTDVRQALQAVKPEVLIEFRQSYIGPAMRTFSNMLRVNDCPADWLSNRVGMVDLRLLSGDTAVHSDMLMWHREDSVENAARQVLNVLFAVPQISVPLADVPSEHRQMLRFYMAFMARHRQLLQAPIFAQAPHMLYPLVRTRLGEEEAVAVYERDKVIEPARVKCSYLFNATSDDALFLRCGEGDRWDAKVCSCLGEEEGTLALAGEGIVRLPVPPGGFALLTRNG